MRLSRRERILIGIFIVVLLLYAAYKLISSSNLFDIETTRSEYNRKTAEYNSVSQNILLRSKYDEKARELSEEINGFNAISNLQQENVIVFLNNYFTNNNINVDSISFTDLAPVLIDPSTSAEVIKEKSTLKIIIDEINKFEQKNQVNDSGNNDNLEQGTESNEDGRTAEKEGDQAPSQDDLTTNAIIVDISFESTYENLMKFIDAIQKHAYNISITNISMISAQSEQGNVLQGDMTLKFYEVPKLDSFLEKNPDWIWKDFTPVNNDLIQ